MDSAKGESKYERLRKIGIGSYGVVFKCINRQTGQIVAIKRYSENDSDPVIRKIAMREVRMLRQLKHPNLINLIEVFRRKHRLHLVFDYCELTVLDVIEKYGNSCPLNLIKKITWQIVNGIDYCHQHNCIHRDIKPENILINQCGVVKLCDFGFARNFNANRLNVSSLIMKTNKMKLGQQRNLAQVGGSEKENIDSSAMNDSQANKSNDRQAFTDYVATRWYRAPELLVGEIYYDVKIDIWAIGCVTAELIRGEPIWPGKTDFDQLCLIKSTLGPLTPRQTQTLLNRAIYDQFNTERLMNQQMSSAESLEKKLSLRVGQCAVEFVSDCLQMDPARRPSSYELLRHKYINSVKIPQLISKESSPLTVGASIDHQSLNSARQVAKGISLVPVPLRQRRFLNQVQHPPRANSQILMLAAQTAARPVAAISTPAKRPLLDAKQDGRQLLSKLQAPVNYGPFATNKTITSNQTAAYNQKSLQRKRQQQISVEKPTNLRRSSQATGASTVRHKFNSIKPKEAASNGVMHKSLLPISKTPSGHQLTDKVVTTGNLVTNKYKFDGDRNRLGSDQSSGSSSIRLDTAFRVGGITNNQQVNAYLIQNELQNSTGNRSSKTCKPEAQTYESFKDKGLIEADCSRLSTDDLPDDSSSFSALASTTMKPNSISFLPPIQSKYNDYHRENEENENDASFDARANHSTGESRTFSQDD